MFEAALLAGITSTGADVILLGPLPTPGIAFLTTSMRADAGIVLSASHNPFEDNGLKVFGHDGFKLPDEVEMDLERMMDSPAAMKVARGHDLGRAKRVDDAMGRYVTHLKTMLRAEYDLSGLRIVVDCANGAAYRAAPTLLSELGATVFAIGVTPDGTNINDGCGSLHPEKAAAAVKSHGAHLGIALDGDADRLILIDERGDVVDGDAVMALAALDLKEHGLLRGDTVVATVMSNLGLEHALSRAGIRLERTAVGDRYVVQRMREGGFNFGGEQSGHLVFLDHATTGDGLVAALQVLNVMQGRQRPLSELAQVMQRLPQVLVNLKVPEKRPLASLPLAAAAMADVEAKLGKDGRILVRYSGTEAKIRVMIEGPDETMIGTFAQEVVAAISKDFGV
jgi:phosphoglucosamine mutase